MIFSIKFWFFLVKIRLNDAHLLYDYLVRQSAFQATKGKNVKIKKHEFLSGYLREVTDSFFCEDSSYWCSSILWIFCSGYKRQKCKNKYTWYKMWLFKIEVWYFLWRFVWLMRIYSLNNLSVRLQMVEM